MAAEKKVTTGKNRHFGEKSTTVSRRAYDGLKKQHNEAWKLVEDKEQIIKSLIQERDKYHNAWVDAVREFGSSMNMGMTAAPQETMESGYKKIKDVIKQINPEWAASLITTIHSEFVADIQSQTLISKQERDRLDRTMNNLKSDL